MSIPAVSQTASPAMPASFSMASSQSETDGKIQALSHSLETSVKISASVNSAATSPLARGLVTPLPLARAVDNSAEGGEKIVAPPSFVPSPSTEPTKSDETLSRREDGSPDLVQSLLPYKEDTMVKEMMAQILPKLKEFVESHDKIGLENLRRRNLHFRSMLERATAAKVLETPCMLELNLYKGLRQLPYHTLEALHGLLMESVQTGMALKEKEALFKFYHMVYSFHGRFKRDVYFEDIFYRHLEKMFGISNLP